MKLKSFFASTVEAALGLAREELGAEAILVNSRKAPPEAKHLGEYEVVAAFVPSETAAAAVGTDRVRGGGDAVAVRWAARSSDEQLRREVADLRRQMERVRKAVWLSGSNRVQAPRPFRPTADILAMLLEADLDPTLAQEIAACVDARLAGDPLLKAEGGFAGAELAPAGLGAETERLREDLTAELVRRFSVDASLGHPAAGSRIAAVVGPPGAGKTTTLAKLAVVCGLRRRQSVQLFSLDTYRIASSEPLRTYAGILGAGFQVLTSAQALEQALRVSSRRDLILIDTPGFGPRDMDAAAEIVALFTAQPEIDVHLVLPATMKSADLTCAVDRFETFRPSKLLFTRLDETSSFGPAFSEAVRTARPISFLATGQQVPEDLQEATKTGVIDLMLEHRSKSDAPAGE
jgi:flagellar biosynthesis protein FlhF